MAASKTHTADSYLSAAGPATTPPTPGVRASVAPISYWKLDEPGTGAVAIDSGPTGANATDNLGNTTASTTVPVAAPVNFTDPSGRFFPVSAAPGISGVKTYLNAGIQSAHGFTNSFTVTAWVRCVGRITNQPFICHNAFVSSGVTLGWNLVADQNGLLGFTAGDGTNQDAALTSEFALPLNVWTHVAAVITASGTGINPNIVGGGGGTVTRYLYFNGRKSVNSDNKQPGASTNVATCLGKDVTGIDNFYFNGDLDDVRIYNVVLTDDQIQALAGGNDPGQVTPVTTNHTTDSWLVAKPTNLISYWKFDESGTGAVAIDSGTSNSNATDSLGNTTPSTTAPIAAPVNFTNPHGRFFPTVGGTKLVTAVQPLHSLTQNFTVAAWVRTSKAANTPIVTHGNSSVAGGWGLSIDTTGVLCFNAFTSAGGSAARAADFVTPTGVWFHVAGVATTSTAYLYLNGQKSVNTNSVLPAASTGVATSLGWDTLNLANHQLNGDLDDVRIYNIALTDAQIASLAAGNDPFGVMTVTKPNYTDALLRATSTKIYTTDALVGGPVRVSQVGSLVITTASPSARVSQVGSLVITTANPGARVSQVGLLVISPHASTWTWTYTTDSWLAQVGTVVETHITDALLRATLVKTQTTDVLLRATLAKTHTTDAWLVATVTKTHTIDAWLRATVTKTHTTDSDLVTLATLVKTHDTDALLRATLTKIHTSDAWLITTVTKTHITDAWLKATIAKTHTTNAWLLATVTKTHITDATLRGAPSKPGFRSLFAIWVGGASRPVLIEIATHTTDAMMFSRRYVTHQSDALVYQTTVTTIQTDALVQGTYSWTHNTDSLIGSPVLVSQVGSLVITTVDPSARVSQVGSLVITTANPGARVSQVGLLVIAPYASTWIRTHFTDSYTGLAVTVVLLPHFTDADLTGFVIQLHATDTLLATVTVYPRVHLTDALVHATFTHIHTTNALLRRASTRTHATDALLRRAITRIHGTDAILHGAVTRVHGTDALLRWAHAVTHKTDALATYVISTTHQTDTLLRGVPIRHHTTDALPMLRRILTHSTDCMLAVLPAVHHFTDALLRGSIMLPNYIDSLLRGTFTHTYTTDAVLCNVYFATHRTDAKLVAEVIHTHKTDALKVWTKLSWHSTDTWSQVIPLVWHKTDAVAVHFVYKTHTTDSTLTHVPISGRWSTPRVGTRTLIDIGSKDRQQTEAGNLYPIGFLLVGHDRITPVMGVVPTVWLLKPRAASWVLAHGAISEVGDGWYQLAGVPADRPVSGEYVLMATSPRGDTVWVKFNVVVPDPYAPITLNSTERNALADVTLTRAFAFAASISARSVIQAVRALWSWKTVPTKPLTVNAEDGTVAWQANVIIDPTIPPVRGMSPPPPP